MNFSLFYVDISELKGVGKKTSVLYKNLGINSIGKLLMYFPVSYENWENVSSIYEISNSKEEKIIKAKISEEVTCIFSRKNKKIYKLKAISENQIITISFFSIKNPSAKMKRGEEFLLSGKFCKDKNGFKVICPKIKNINSSEKIVPLYPQSSKLPSWKIARATKEAIKLLPEKVKETLPYFLIDKFNLATYDFMIKKIHFPFNLDELNKAKRRFLFEELLIWKFAMFILKNKISLSNKNMIPNDKNVHKETKRKIGNESVVIKDFSHEFLEKLPFELTKSQKKVIFECIEDMKNPKLQSMKRLLQGDVGSGKTVIAMALSYNIIKNGFKAIVMVPSEILAFQHHKRFLEVFEKFHDDDQTFKNIYLFTKSTSKKQKEILVKILSDNNPAIIIGTHALITDDLKIANLAFVVIDEQHKFGVNQRLKLISKSFLPHILVMSATPIPRSLALVFYGDLDFSVLNELPSGRKEIKTFLMESGRRSEAIEFLENKLEEGSQGFIVCPLINKSEELISLTDYREKYLTKDFVKKFKPEIIHGKLKKNEKENIMNDFYEGKIKLLISTTIIEVGIDAPKASVIIIENPERFGMATLHQLRGRVGRNSNESYCILISDSKWGSAYRRLKTIKSSNDGFYLANQDLEQRGPGEFFGERQHGEFNRNLIEALKDDSIVNDCDNAIREVITRSPNLDSDESKFIKSKILKLISSF